MTARIGQTRTHTSSPDKSVRCRNQPCRQPSRGKPKPLSHIDPPIARGQRSAPGAMRGAVSSAQPNNPSTASVMRVSRQDRALPRDWRGAIAFTRGEVPESALKTPGRCARHGRALSLEPVPRGDRQLCWRPPLERLRKTSKAILCIDEIPRTVVGGVVFMAH